MDEIKRDRWSKKRQNKAKMANVRNKKNKPDEETPQEPPEIEFSSQEAVEILKNWREMTLRDDTEMTALLLWHHFHIERFMDKQEADKEVGMILGYHQKTIETWRHDFYNNKGTFSLSREGKYDRQRILEDEDCRKKAITWVRQNAYKKGEPNMTAYDFCKFVNC